jgi:LacI family transcriptional regulator
MRITTKTLARMCGVSVGSVDRALHNRPGISEQTKAKILKTAEAVGYRPHLPARSLVTGKTNTVGIIVFDLSHTYFSQVVTACISRLTDAGYFAYVAVSNQHTDEERRCLDNMASLGVDGIIVLPINKGTDFHQFVKSLNRPIVTIGNFLSRDWPFVSVDYESACFDAVEFLAMRGYRRIVHLSPPLARNREINAYAVERRAEGYRRAIRSLSGLEAPEIITGSRYLDQLDELRLSANNATAILCSSDVYALRALTYLTKKGARIPGDLGLMGFDNIETLEYIHPSLATVDCSIRETGSRAAECLLSEFAGEYVSPILPHTIIEGETV